MPPAPTPRRRARSLASGLARSRQLFLNADSPGGRLNDMEAVLPAHVTALVAPYRKEPVLCHHVQVQVVLATCTCMYAGRPSRRGPVLPHQAV